MGEDDNKEIDEIHRSLISEEWTNKIIANYYRLRELLYSHERGSGELFSQEIEDCRKKAKSYYSVSQSISLNEVDSIDKNIKKDIKELRKNLKRLRSERIETEKHKIIEPIDLSLFHIARQSRLHCCDNQDCTLGVADCETIPAYLTDINLQFSRSNPSSCSR